MIAYLSGTLMSHTKDGGIVLCGSVGYEVLGSWLTRQSIGTPLDLLIYEYLENESIPRMVGFRSLKEREVFLQLLNVSGVGPKMASRIVDAIPENELIKAISSGDVTTLASVKGLGKKTAQKIILELGKILVTETDSAYAGLYEALATLKFTKPEIDRAIQNTPLDGLSENAQLSALLKTLGSRR